MPSSGEDMMTQRERVFFWEQSSTCSMGLQPMCLEDGVVLEVGVDIHGSKKNQMLTKDNII